VSFDLHIRALEAEPHTPEEIIDRVRSKLVKHPVEVVPLPGERLLSVGLPGGTTDEIARRVYTALLELAKAHGYRVHDPQAGTDVDTEKPGRYPPGWVSSLTFAQVRALTRAGRFSELLQQLHRVSDPDMTDRQGEPLLNAVLADAWNLGPTRPHVPVAEDVALALLARGASPLRKNERGVHAVYWAVMIDSPRLVLAILDSLGEAERKAVLSEKHDGKTWLDRAISSRAKRAEKVLRRAGGK
jgi:hypothetical protein